LQRYHFFKTRAGVFLIVQRGERWHAQYQGEELGVYATPEQAATDLATGKLLASCGETAALGIPPELGKWSFREE
jgi:hypothetical protein